VGLTIIIALPEEAQIPELRLLRQELCSAGSCQRRCPTTSGRCGESCPATGACNQGGCEQPKDKSIKV
jgi:hypothetical protein